MTGEEYIKAVQLAKEHILAGDIFQIVLSLRYERRTFADPFEVYRALRIVNPSPYMGYVQVYFPFWVVHFLDHSTGSHGIFLFSQLHRLEAVFWLLQVQKFLPV